MNTSISEFMNLWIKYEVCHILTERKQKKTISMYQTIEITCTKCIIAAKYLFQSDNLEIISTKKTLNMNQVLKDVYIWFNEICFVLKLATFLHFNIINDLALSFSMGLGISPLDLFLPKYLNWTQTKNSIRYR